MCPMLPVCAALMIWPVTAAADDPPQPTETVIRLTVSPIAERKPALYHQLLPELKEMNPGNPIFGYLKCFMGQDPFFGGKDANEQREKWLAMPLKDLPVKELRDYGGFPLKRADEAARLSDVDWQSLLPLRKDGVYLAVPELQRLRTLASALEVRLRGEIADRRFDDALVTAKTMLALSRHIGEHPTVIGGLVGLAVASRAVDRLDEFIGQPGAPNLYWALTDLPNPLVGWRSGVQGERMWLGVALQGIPGRIPLDPERRARLIKIMQDLSDLSRMEGKDKKIDVEAWLTERANKPDYLDAARKRLIETGFPPEPLAKLPPIQAILVDEVVSFEIERDNQMKYMNLPYWQAEAFFAKAGKKVADDSLLGGLVQSFYKIRRSHARFEQRVALLRCVEGLRMYAAAHKGELPPKLADAPVPLPVDPISGQPFTYALKDDTATLRGSAPAGQEKTAAFNVRYEIKIAR